MRTVKDWESKCLFYDEEEEVIILRKKAFILKNLIRHNFNYISQLVTSNKVKIADMIDFNNEKKIFCSSFWLNQRAECGFSHISISLSRSSGFAFSCVATVSEAEGVFSMFCYHLFCWTVIALSISNGVTITAPIKLIANCPFNME